MTRRTFCLPVDGNPRDGVRGDEGDADGQHPREELAHDLRLGPGPALVHNLRQGHGGHQGAQQQVAQGQVHDQDVAHLTEKIISALSTR